MPWIEPDNEEGVVYKKSRHSPRPIRPHLKLPTLFEDELFSIQVRETQLLGCFRKIYYVPSLLMVLIKKCIYCHLRIFMNFPNECFPELAGTSIQRELVIM